MKRFLPFALTVALVLSMVSMVSFAATTQDIFTVEELEQYVVHTELLSTDGYIGIPVGIKTYIKDPDAATTDTQVILYVVNTQTANVGRGDDATIISGMLDRGYIVVVLDYFDAPETATSDLDWSIQQIRLLINKGSYLNSAAHFEYSYVVPQGYDLKRDIVFWSVDKHAADGVIEHIIRSWNTDFLGVKGDKYYITFEEDTVISGVSFTAGQTLTPSEYTAMLPEGKVTSIFECIGPNGKLVEMDLYMDIIYPVNPEKEVPVMVYACSGDYTMDTWNKNIRPHLTGFLMDGYAACYSHPYVPMGSGRMYGYYDGTNAAGAVTGDSSNGSLDQYNGLRVDTAAVRYVRYVAEEYKFATDRVGVTGISKTGSVLRLGHPHPETLPEDQYYVDHTGETRYDNGLTEDMVGTTGVFRDAEAQPWLTYEGTDTVIPSNVQFVFTSVGGGQQTITPEHAPIYICGTMQPSGSYYGGFYPFVMTYSRMADVPVMDYVCENVGHDFPYGPDKETGNDQTVALAVEKGASAFSAVRVSTTADSFTLDDVVVSDAAVVTLADAELTTKIPVEPQPELKFSNAALELHNNLAIQFKVRAGLIDTTDYAEPYVTFLFNGETYTVDTYTEADDQYIFTFTDIAPDKMGDTIQATLHADWNGEVVSSSVLNYSVKDYCYRMLRNSAVVNSDLSVPCRAGQGDDGLRRRRLCICKSVRRD